jgi:hypothetical protein
MLEAVPIAQVIPEHLVELWEERAAIIEYQGKLAREDAEWLAFLCVCGGVEAMEQDHNQQPHTRAKDTQMRSLTGRYTHDS